MLAIKKIMQRFDVVWMVKVYKDWFIFSRLSRRRQLGVLVPLLRLGVPLRCKACKLCDPLRYPPLIKKSLRTTPRLVLVKLAKDSVLVII